MKSRWPSISQLESEGESCLTQKALATTAGVCHAPLQLEENQGNETRGRLFGKKKLLVVSVVGEEQKLMNAAIKKNHHDPKKEKCCTQAEKSSKITILKHKL